MNFEVSCLVLDDDVAAVRSREVPRLSSASFGTENLVKVLIAAVDAAAIRVPLVDGLDRGSGMTRHRAGEKAANLLDYRAQHAGPVLVADALSLRVRDVRNDVVEDVKQIFGEPVACRRIATC